MSIRVTFLTKIVVTVVTVLTVLIQRRRKNYEKNVVKNLGDEFVCDAKNVVLNLLVEYIF